MVWRDGIVPAEGPSFSPQLTYDLQSYGYSLLSLGLWLLDSADSTARARQAFENAAAALDAAVARGPTEDEARSFHLLVAAAAYHLARRSAQAYSLIRPISTDANFSAPERAVALLMLRSLDALDALVIERRSRNEATDTALANKLEQGVHDANNADVVADVLDEALADRFFAAMSAFLVGLERGSSELVGTAASALQTGLEICGQLNLVPQWWIFRLAIHLINDLWNSSFHTRLPEQIDGGSADDWSRLRKLYIALLQRRSRAEIDLWPSQVEAAARAANHRDHLVASLPTSAGKTRVAELCILRCLADGKRVAFVTPLRALSAQTEVTLQRTFAPLGASISALYGSIGASSGDVQAIGSRDIVVATPEKLDFALRSNPELLDNVGLLVFDEGHMIGLSEREVRYEIQIQRLLRRTDATQRRVVCLSAILPDGEQLDDFANWMRQDQPGGAVRSDWRPTRLRFGEIVWQGTHARLNLRVGDERTFVPKFLTATLPAGRRTRQFPADLGELCLASAWRLVEDGQTVLIFCPVRAHVEPFASRIVDLHRRGTLTSVLGAPPESLTAALVLGAEYLGAHHPVLACLKLGVAIHHGALPTGYRAEVERLLRDGALKITISSPTLAQGLNLSATAVVMHSLSRNRERISAAEFKNVIGRAGRAYVDLEGLVLYPMYDRVGSRTAEWEALLADADAKEMESGLLRLVYTLAQRMYVASGSGLTELFEYIMNNARAWEFVPLLNEPATDRDAKREEWRTHIATLDTAILGLIGDAECDVGSLAQQLDAALQSSLWTRRLARRPNLTRALNAALLSRARYIWNHSTAATRRGYFLAGLGLESGKALDAAAPSANELLVAANAAILTDDHASAIEAITSLARIVFVIPPFVPRALPADWQSVLKRWLAGEAIAQTSAEQTDTLQFVEDAFVYRLPWAMEALRVRGMAVNDVLNSDLSLSDVELGLAVAAVEMGTLDRSATVLMQAGFKSRAAALLAIRDTGASFKSFPEMRLWLASEDVQRRSSTGTWPTPETAGLWSDFVFSTSPRVAATWSQQELIAPVDWYHERVPVPDRPVQVRDIGEQSVVLSAEGDRLGQLRERLNPNRLGLLLASISADGGHIALVYLGPRDLSG